MFQLKLTIYNLYCLAIKLKIFDTLLKIHHRCKFKNNVSIPAYNNYN